MEKESLFMWEHPLVGKSISRFEIIRAFISNTFSVLKMLARNVVEIEVEVIDEDEDQTSYLFTVTGTGFEPGTCIFSLTVEGEDVCYVCNDGDLDSVTPELLRDILFFNMIYGFNE